jgi:hypothetical protein
MLTRRSVVDEPFGRALLLLNRSGAGCPWKGEKHIRRCWSYAPAAPTSQSPCMSGLGRWRRQGRMARPGGGVLPGEQRIGTHSSGRLACRWAVEHRRPARQPTTKAVVVRPGAATPGAALDFSPALLCEGVRSPTWPGTLLVGGNREFPDRRGCPAIRARHRWGPSPSAVLSPSLQGCVHTATPRSFSGGPDHSHRGPIMPQ